MQNKPVITGKCNQMCPESEIVMREQQRMLHPMEVLDTSRKQKQPKADRNKMVKEFCRSSAGQTMQKPEVLRPYNVLMDTIIYLLDQAISMEEFPFHVRYDFICDRLRAVRQDMIIQDIPKTQAICLLQPIVRFYAYASYRLCDENLQKYDPHLNDKHFQECMKRLLAMYDDCEECSTRCEQKIDYSSLYEDVRPQIEAIYILFNLGNEEALHRALGLNSRWRNTAEVRSALKLSLLYRNRNFVAVCRTIKQLPHLLAAVAALHLPAIRRNCLQIMSCGYSSKNLQFPLSKLRELLCYSRGDDVLEDLRCCGLEYHLVDHLWDTGDGDHPFDGGVLFIKGKFNDGIKLNSRKEEFVVEKLGTFYVQELLLFGV